MNIQLKDVDNVVFNGIDVSAVKFNDVLVWRKWETIEYTGAVPVTINAAGEPLIDLIISGNMSQTGTPTPTTPIQPQECGERTGNLCNPNLTRYEMAYNGQSLIDFNGGALYLIPAEPNTTYTLKIYATEVISVVRLGLYDKAVPQAGDWVDNIQLETNKVSPSITITNTNYPYLLLQITGAYIDNYGLSQVMLNTGSTALPYVPYGYKLDISSGGENLFDKNSVLLNYEISENSIKSKSGWAVSDYIPVSGGATYASTNVGTNALVYSEIGGASTQISKSGTTFTVPNGANFMRINLLMSNLDVAAINLGSTAKPYSPYNRSKTPVYLGEVETTRQIKKLVLDGTENWKLWAMSASSTTERFYINVVGVGAETSICSHFQYAENNSDTIHFRFGGTNRNELLFWIDKQEASTVADFKTYLQQQYSAGTPVTVWYALATPTTGIVNEPLRKIGNYADSLSVSQTIPTVKGSNVIDVETTLKPSEVYIKYKGKTT